MTPRERLFALEQFGIKLGLDNIRTLVDALERPDHAWPAVHVAGTNGKGSVTAMVERGLRAAGHRTGRYTSPHLDRIEERVAIDGQPVEAAVFDRAAADVLDLVDRLTRSGALAATPTFFEVTTAMAFEIFRREGVEAAVVEVGLGGRYDATNAITPLACAITSIAIDHERHLGSTLEQIAFEKAGIIKAGIPVVVGAMPGVARDVITTRARDVGAPVVEADEDLVEALRLERGRATLSLRTPRQTYPEVRLGLSGAHQVANAVVAARTLEVCGERGLAVSACDVVTGLSDVEWPGRLEWLRAPDGQHVLIDAAHNPAGAAALADYLVAGGMPPLPLVLAVMNDKDVDAIVDALAPVVSQVIATEVQSARALPSAELAARIMDRSLGTRVSAVPDVDAALGIALAEQGRAVVAGSIFLAGPVRARLIARGASPVPWPG